MEEGETKGVQLRLWEDCLTYIYISVKMLKPEIFHYLFDYNKKQQLLVHIFLLIFPFCMNFMVPHYPVNYPAECMIVNYQNLTVLQAFFPLVFPSFMPKQGKEV